MICPHGPLRGDYYRKDPSEVAKAVCEGISEKYHVASNYSTVGDVLNRASKSKGKRVYTWRKCVVWPSESLAFYFAIRGRSVRELLLWCTATLATFVHVFIFPNTEATLMTRKLPRRYSSRRMQFLHLPCARYHVMCITSNSCDRIPLALHHEIVLKSASCYRTTYVTASTTHFSTLSLLTCYICAHHPIYLSSFSHIPSREP